MFEFSGHGTREGVIKALQAKQLPENKDPKQEAVFKRAGAQMKALKEFVVAEINALPAQFNGCRVSASATVNPQSSTANVNVIGEAIHV
jgi:hypothetical protein